MIITKQGGFSSTLCTEIFHSSIVTFLCSLDTSECSTLNSGLYDPHPHVEKEFRRY